ncbi:Alpha/Beta hydrolase protein, partial [Dichotomocladium elegans]
IFWLNGGPGCSSMDGMFLENGPYRVNHDLTLNITTGGWQDYATIVIVDQPAGTGFSYADHSGYMKNMEQVTDEFITFLDKFFGLFPHLKNYDTYLAGESFAGTYIPYFATRMLERNKKGKDQYNLQGIAIGNGWISPKHQYEAYRDFADANKLIPDRRQQLIDSALLRCRSQLKEEERINIGACERILEYILEGTITTKDDIEYCINEYDIRIKDELKSEGCGMSWPHDLDFVKAYLSAADVKKAINVNNEGVNWSECNDRVYSQLDLDEDEPSYYLLPAIMEEIPVLLFSGDQDLICNVLGTQYLIGNMTWNGAKGFKFAEALNWYIDDKVVGTFTSERNLTFVVIHGGSHMVPYDKPMESLDMINRFIGVGNNKVNGLYSRIGEEPVIPASGADVGDESELDKDEWAQYYSWGTSALIIVIFIACAFGYCWYKSRKQAREGYRQPLSNNEPMGGGFLGLFGKGNRSNWSKLRLGDQDDTNEL